MAHDYEAPLSPELTDSNEVMPKMKSLERQIDLPQMLFTLMFILLLIAACLWVVQPFILGFAWASMVVIATWPLMLKIQRLLWGQRFLAVIVMTILLLLLFIIPVALLVNSLIDNSAPVIAWATQGHMLPTLSWLNDIPMVGEKLYASYQKLVAGPSWQNCSPMWAAPPASLLRRPDTLAAL